MGSEIIVIGASVGGVRALTQIAAGLSHDLNASLFVVIHTTPDAPGFLADILGRAGEMRALYAQHGQKIERGCIYIAPPDYHLLVEKGTMGVVRGPKENLHRPSIDVLFRSAAAHYGSRAAGVILSGYLDDGVAGLGAIGACGGTTIVQDPEDAEAPILPRNALRYVDVDHQMPLKAIPILIQKLVNSPRGKRRKRPTIPKNVRIETEIAAMRCQGREVTGELGMPASFSCPECHGPLWRINDKRLARYRCHIGHAYSAEALSWDQHTTIERALSVALQTLEESKALALQMATRAKKERQRSEAKIFDDRAKKAIRHAALIRQLLMETGMKNSNEL